MKFWVGANGLPLKLESDAVGRVLGFTSHTRSTALYDEYGATIRIVAPM